MRPGRALRHAWIARVACQFDLRRHGNLRLPALQRTSASIIFEHDSW
jgi:hypothetical protein